jgi:hypothetical protein
MSEPASFLELDIEIPPMFSENDAVWHIISGIRQPFNKLLTDY